MPYLRRFTTVIALALGLVMGGVTAFAALHPDEDSPVETVDRAIEPPVPAPEPKRATPGDPEPTAPTEKAAPDPAPDPAPAPAEPAAPAAPPLLAPGDESDDVRDLQARLRQIAWFDHDVTGYYGDITAEAVRGFQAKRELPTTGTVDQPTLDRLHAMTREPTADDLANRAGTTSSGSASGDNTPGALDARCEQGRVLCIDKTSRTLRWVVDGEVRTTVDVRFGAEATPTREGVFDVYVKSRDHVSSLFDSSMPFAMFFDGGQAVHYSPEFAAEGYAGGSHGCVNVRDEAAIEGLFDEVDLGDTVVVYRS